MNTSLTIIGAYKLPRGNVCRIERDGVPFLSMLPVDNHHTCIVNAFFMMDDLARGSVETLATLTAEA